MKKTYTLLPLTLWLSACSFTPVYQQPTVDLPQTATETALQAETIAAGEKIQNTGWRQFFRDPQLQTLIATALQHNHDLRRAALNIEMARAQYDIRLADKMPTVAANGTINRQRRSASVSGANATINNTYAVGLGMAAFELDFFGRVQALSEQALNEYLATREAKDAAQLAVISAVAKTYERARIARSQMALADSVLKSRQESYRLSQLQARAGLISARDLYGAEAQIESARAAYADAKRNHQKALNALAQLLGKPVGQIDLPPAVSVAQQFVNLILPADIPSTVLLRRPDIREAEYRLKAANANIGAARAALYPTISLTGSAGLLSLKPEQLFKYNNSQWSLGPSVSLPIFDAGKRKRSVTIAETGKQQLIENYQNVVQSAFYEVADALAAKTTLNEQYRAQQRANQALKERLRLENLRFKHGVNTALDLLDAQRAAYSGEQALLMTELAMLDNYIDLYITMGGGLEEYGVSLPGQE